MKKKPDISIISPCFNHGKYIRDMLASVFCQTFSFYEVIIVNDGSTDDTRQILESISHERVTVIHTDNQGPAAARNLAIEHARAPIILNLDADDTIAPELLEKAHGVFRDRPGSGIVCCDAECFGARTGKFDIGLYSREAMLFDNRIISQAFFRKEDWLAVGGYSSDLVYGLEDWDFWLSIIELGREVVNLPEAMVYYRTYDNPADCRSGRRKQDRMKLLKSQAIIFHRHEKLYASCPEAWRHFSKIEEKLRNENPLVRLLKNFRYAWTRKGGLQ